MRLVFIVLVILNVIAGGVLLFSSSDEAVVGTFQNKGGESLRLLSELEVINKLNVESQLIPGRSGEEEGDSLCLYVGSFEDKVLSKKVVERLAAWDILASSEDLELPVGKGYWVYLPPEVSKQAAMRKLKELQAQGLDSYVIPKGNLENGISFGVFSSEERAIALQGRIAKQGYSVLTAEIERTEKQNWVVVDKQMGAFLNDLVWEKVLEIAPGIEREKRYCLGVAQRENIQ